MPKEIVKKERPPTKASKPQTAQKELKSPKLCKATGKRRVRKPIDVKENSPNENNDQKSVECLNKGKSIQFELISLR